MGFIDRTFRAIDRVGFTLAKSSVDPAIAQAMADAGMDTRTPLGPGAPLAPAWGYNGRPRDFDYTTGANVSARPRSTERVSFRTLRALVEAYDIAQLCISHRIASIRSLDFTITPAKGYEDYDLSDAIDYADRKLAYPDGELPFDAWLSKALYDLLAFDAMALYKMRDQAGNVIGLDVIDGTTIAPLLDQYGRRPLAPAPAYAQFIQGLDALQLDETQLVYVPFMPTSKSLYGRAPIESVLLNANLDLRVQAFFMQRFTDGNIPQMFGIAPETWTPDQITGFQDAWDAWLAGDQSAKSQIKWVPGGTKFQDTNEANAQFNKDMSDWLLRKTAAAFHVTPADLGFTDTVNRSSGETQADVQERTADRPTTGYIAGILSRYLQDDLGLPLRFEFILDSDDEDGLATAQSDDLYVKMGAWSVSEVREKRLGLTDPPGERIPRYVLTAKGPVPLSDLLGSSTSIDPDTTVPAAGTVMPADQSAQLALEPSVPPAPEAVKAELRKFTAYTNTRAKRGRGWRDFQFGPVIDARTARELNRAGAVTVRKDTGVPSVAGLAVLAADTGRVLMLQRALDPGDPDGGYWEFPGGHIEGGESPAAAAFREWQEEVGCPLPAGTLSDNGWASPNGVYVGHVFVVDVEAAVPCRIGSTVVLNPDDPDGDMVETVAWWDPKQMINNPAVRPALAADLPLALAAINDTIRAAALYAPAAELAGADADPLVRKGWRDGAPKTPQHDYDLQLTDYYAPLIQDALTDWVGTLPIAAVAIRFQAEVVKDADTDALKKRIREALDDDTVTTTPPELRKLLATLAADASTAGQHAASVQLAGHTVEAQGVAPATTTIDWDTWAPGNPPAGAAAAGGGTQALLDQAGITVQGITSSALDEVGNRIGDGLTAGDSIDTIAGSIRDLIGDPGRADRIAHTESTRAVISSTFDVYQASGVGQWDMVLSDGACQECADVADANPHDSFDLEDAPPIHPYCRCASSPVVSSVTVDSVTAADPDLQE